jgi:hypothetical protein
MVLRVKVAGREGDHGIPLRLPARLDSPWVTGLFGVAVALLTWDYVQVIPIAGLDASWILGINLAAAEGLDHGTEVVFTYGPLGFLEQPMVTDGLLATLAAVYLLAIRALLAASLLWAARRSFPWPLAALLALAVAALTPRAVGSVVLALAVVWCLVALDDEAPPWSARALAVGGGALAALELLIRANVGLTVLALVAVPLVAIPRGRATNLLALAGAFAAGLVVFWLAAGQGITSLDEYASTAAQLLSGFSEAMQANAMPESWDGWAAAALAVATLGAALHASGGLPAPRRAATLAVVALLLLALFKYGFVRHDPAHVGAFFGTLGAVWVALRWRGRAHWAPAAGLAAIAVAYFPLSDETLDSTFEPVLAVDQLTTLAVPSERRDASEEAGAALRSAYALDPRIVETIGSETVDVRPWEIALAWAYGLEWRPLPVLQDYTAYTPELDGLNAEALAAPGGPRFIVRHFGFDGNAATGLEGRYTTFDSPLATRALLCGYRPLLTSGAYQLLERGEPRCGEPRPLGSATAAYGERVEVPTAPPGEAVFASIEGTAAGGLERLRTLLYRAAIRHVDLGATARARFVPRNAPSGLLLRAPADADFPDPFRLAPDVDSLAIDSEGGFATSDGPLEVEFFAVPIEPLARAGTDD